MKHTNFIVSLVITIFTYRVNPIPSFWERIGVDDNFPLIFLLTLFPTVVILMDAFSLVGEFRVKVFNEMARDQLFYCPTCKKYMREYQFQSEVKNHGNDEYRVYLCPACYTGILGKIEEEMDWMKDYPDFKKKGFIEIVGFVFGYEVRTKRKIRRLEKEVKALLEVKSFMDYRRMDRDFPDDQKEFLEDTVEMEKRLKDEVEKLVKEVPIYAVERVRAIVERFAV